MKFAVDRIENDIVILENIDDCMITQVNVNEFGFNIKEKDIVCFDGNKYYLDELTKEERLKRIREKMKRLKNND